MVLRRSTQLMQNTTDAVFLIDRNNSFLQSQISEISNMIKLAVVDGDAFWCDMLGNYFQKSNHATSISIYHDEINFQNKIATIDVQIIIIDSSLPCLNIMHFINQCKLQRPEINLVVSSAWVQHDLVYKCLKAGASGYINKFSPPEEIVEVIKNISSEKSVLQLQIAEQLLLQKSFLESNNLTHLQRQLVNLTSKGFSFTEMVITLKCTREQLQLITFDIYKLMHQKVLLKNWLK